MVHSPAPPLAGVSPRLRLILRKMGLIAPSAGHLLPELNRNGTIFQCVEPTHKNEIPVCPPPWPLIESPCLRYFTLFQPPLSTPSRARIDSDHRGPDALLYAATGHRLPYRICLVGYGGARSNGVAHTLR